ncbi:glutamate receptor ionotropic, kainate 2-like isoform X5 [Daphnia pulex]|uniref:glutamate receptor ionotropic, kainate 2-like isoform X5 n=1 Tax=Daphnia pulex TaxID=6669 RepID=UPI001EE08E36|nr:glutamate receptor ionotropic, kainate 2-like isoform X5 [Daphnia pulex]
MGAAAVRKREKWKWLLPSWAPATTLSGTHEETFRADDIRLSAGYWSSSSSSWNSRSFTCLLALAFIFQSVSALPPVIRIGGIFREDQKDGSAELAFKYAVYRLNRERTILPNTTLVYDIQYVPRDDSFRTSKKACKQIDFGVQAIFGPSDPVLGPHVQSICDALDIPHLETRLDLESRTSARNELSINLHPSQEVLNAAYKDLMRFLNWTKVAIIYEDEGGLLRLQDLVRSPPTSKMEVHIRQGTVNTYRQVLREIKQRDINNIIVDTRTEHVHIFFRAVLQLQMNDYQYHYLFASPDLETFDLEDFKYNFVNISAFRIVDAESNFTRQLLRDMEKFQPIGQSILNKSNIIQAEPALVYDSVMALAHGLAALDRGTALRLANLSCDIEQPWNDGSSLFNYINTVEFVGLTGPIRFKEGRRSNITLDLLKLKRENLTKVGEWNGQSGLNITDPVAFYEGSTPNITLIVMTNEEMPYVMLRSERNLTGNDRYEGFCIDLLKAIAGMVGFNYVIEMVPDKKYGALDPETGEWNGVVRQILEKKADLAVGSMTINYAREMVIDFTKPFMNLGISILFKAASTRIVGGIWWFFTLIIISSYTANLAAFLTVERMIAPIDSVEDLADQSDISYGTLEAGSTMTFFRDSRIETYQKMWRYMESKKPSVFVSTYEEGTKRVMEGNFAFLMESTTLDYVVQRNCNLTQIGGLLDSKGYGIGTPKGSPWRDRISLAILELQEKGSIHLLYNKWWKDTGDVCNRDDKNKESKASALGVENIGGVFVVLLCGLAMAIVVAILEFCWNSKRNAQQEKQSLCSEMGEELRFALRCQGSRQRPTLRRSCLRCTPPSHTYVPTNHDVPPLHGVRENGVMPMIELRKASIVQSYDLDN